MRIKKEVRKAAVADLQARRLEADLKADAIRGGQLLKGTRPGLGVKWEGPDFDA